jgi:hypothetical protein
MTIPMVLIIEKSYGTPPQHKKRPQAIRAQRLRDQVSARQRRRYIYELPSESQTL